MPTRRTGPGSSLRAGARRSYSLICAARWHNLVPHLLAHLATSPVCAAARLASGKRRAHAAEAQCDDGRALEAGTLRAGNYGSVWTITRVGPRVRSNNLGKCKVQTVVKHILFITIQNSNIGEHGVRQIREQMTFVEHANNMLTNLKF